MYTVQCDFDDTITMGNVSMELREAFCPEQEQWRQIEEEYVAGQLSVEESNRKQFALLKASQRDIEGFVARTTEVRPGFTQLVDYCRREGIRFTIVSSGLDLYIEPVLLKLGMLNLERYSGRARVTSQGLLVSYIDPRGVDRKEGFKLACLGHLREGGQPIVYIGDGKSDLVPAQEADYVIARGQLRDHFRLHSLPHFTFETFYDVQEHLQELYRRQIE